MHAGRARAHTTSAGVLVALCFVAFFALGLPEGALGVAWPSVRAGFGRRLADLGILLVAYNGSYLAGSLVAGPLAARIGTRQVLCGAAGVAAAGAATFAAAGSFTWLVVAMAVLGAAGGGVDTGVNAFLALDGSLRTLGLAHAFYGVGATVGPLTITGLLIGGGSWRPAYAAIAAVQVVLAAAFLRAPRIRGLAPRAAALPAPGDGGPELPRHAIVVGIAMFFIYVGIEATAGQWAFSLLTEARDETAGVAGALTAVYWGGLTVGRFVVAFAADRLHPERLLDGCLAGAAAGFLLLWLDTGPVVAGAGLAIAGASLAFVFPTLVSLTPARVGADRATAVVGYQVAAAALGGAVIPGAAGIVFATAGLEALSPVVLGCTGALFLLHRFASR